MTFFSTPFSSVIYRSYVLILPLLELFCLGKYVIFEISTSSLKVNVNVCGNVTDGSAQFECQIVLGLPSITLSASSPGYSEVAFTVMLELGILFLSSKSTF